MPNELRTKALDYLARREHSRLELQRKLAKIADSEQIEALLETLKQEGLQSDARFAENYVRSRIAAGFGPNRIRQELQQRGVETEIIAMLLEESDWDELLESVWRKKFNAKTPTNHKEFAQQVRFLVQRGFSQSSIMQLLKCEL